LLRGCRPRQLCGGTPLTTLRLSTASLENAQFAWALQSQASDTTLLTNYTHP